MSTQKTTDEDSETGAYSKGLPAQLNTQAEEPHRGTETETLSAVWKSWLISTSKEIQPILKEIVVFAIFILGDLFILWLAGFGFTDVDQFSSVIGLGYIGLKIASLAVLSIHFLVNCVVEVRKERQRIRQEERQRR